MSLRRVAPLRGFVRSLEHSRRAPRCVSFVSRRYESTNRPDNLGEEARTRASFKDQLDHSTSERMRLSREERQKYVAARAGNPSGRNWAITFVVLAAAFTSYYLGRLNPRDPEPSSTVPLAATKPPRHNTAPVNLQAAWVDFKEIIGEENVSTTKEDVETHAGSDWSSHREKANEKPFLVVYPATTEEVSEIMKVCYRRKIPVTAYSGGTSLEGHFTATRGGICIDFRRMDKILKLHEDDLDVVVQPAVGWELLNEELAKSNLFFPPDPGPGAMIGGMIGTGCSGTNAYRYGTMREWVISLTVVLADGTVIKTRQRPRKSSAGYDLTKMFIGSEGTLGLVTEATLKVTTKPAYTSVAICSFGTVRQAAECVSKVVKEGVPIAAIEILDDVQMKCINAAGSTERTWTEAPTLFFKFSGTPNGVKEQIDIVKKLAKTTGSKTFEFAKNQQEQDDLWSARKEALWSVIAMRRDENDHVWTGDVAVPISRLPDIVEETKEDILKSGLLVAIVGHVGDGNFHAIMMYPDSERKKAEDLFHRMVKRAVDMEGTVTGEHGVGLVKRDYLSHELGETTVDAMRKLKLAFDPLCLLNCDKIVRVQRPAPGEIAEW